MLSGRVDNIKYIPIKSKSQKNRRRYVQKDLLLQSIDLEDQDSDDENQVIIQDSEPQKTILDDDSDIDSNLPTEIDLSINLYTPKSEINDEFEDEFARLAVESVKNTNLVENNDFYDTSFVTEQEDDPFDTTIAANINPGKAELKLIEQEILNDIGNDDFFDPRAEEKLKLILSPPIQEYNTNDLLKTSSSFFDFNAETIKPTTAIEYKDPFDTSIAAEVSKPGKIELKFIANEILSSIDDSCDDFNPREFEPEIKQPLHLNLSKSVAFNLEEGTEKAHLRRVSTPYLHKGFEQDIADTLLSTNDQLDIKVLTPTTTTTEIEDNFDPFDTSICNNVIAPGKIELKILAQELQDKYSLKEDSPTDLISANTDFNLSSISVKPLSPISKKNA